MHLRQSYKGGIRDLLVQDLEHASSAVALLNICHSYAAVMARKQENVSVHEMAFAIADNHDLHGILRDMFLDFGDCMFTLHRDGVEYVMSHDSIVFERPEEAAANDNV